MTTEKNKIKLIKNSGFILEYAISKTINEFGYSILAEYQYERDDETGTAKKFAGDLVCRKEIHGHNVTLLVECKQTDETIDWLFLPSLQMKQHLNVVPFVHTYKLGPFKAELKMEQKEVIHLFGNSVYKGIEIRHSDKTDFLIQKAIAQVSYPIFNEIYLSSLFWSLSKPDKAANSIIPIVITTSPLYIVNPNVTVETLENAKETKDIASPVASLLYSANPSEDLKSHNRKILLNIKKLAGRGERNEFLLELFANTWPEAILFVNYNYHKEIIGNLEKYFQKNT
ncbi:hypothetical protein [Leptospira licerasiae]|uniref:DUF4365 domain-containing protein n=1 Tax=Leptospira licerasiae str. MMD4847 TaxID=1049971 RepID=A0ABN0HEA9_9LEPT|nr:hypothetical protein [Leptospira licerasiae]EIE03402.1 hypothetical protein LEP1GSC185_3546 [Leptospira licerasiae serovar Varillal str. VAR 010]EJZ43999.1 hypothetical protein LEP1GSC178_2349 [Leptospira licerasiae str. MMD4847]